MIFVDYLVACSLLALLARAQQLHFSTQREKTATSSSWREDHLVQNLPFAEGQIPINESYAGYAIVRKDSDTESALWYWYFPAEEPLEEHPPVVVWVQGGPGASSMLGLFEELGPFVIDEDLKLVRNPYTWSKHYSLIFVDNPVGTGYSYVDPPYEVSLTPLELKYFGDGTIRNPSANGLRDETSQAPIRPSTTSTDNNYEKGYAHNENGVSEDFITFLLQFYSNFPEQKKSSLVLTSESYGGKYIPSMATAILDHNEKASLAESIPLKAIAIGNQWTDPNTQILEHGPQALYLGLISPSQAAELVSVSMEAVSLNLKGDLIGALDKRVSMFDLFTAYSGGVNFYDVRRRDVDYDQYRTAAFLTSPEIKKALHVGDRDFGTDSAVMHFLREDIMKTTAPLFPRLLESMPVMLYQGQFDFRDGVASQHAWIDNIQWSGMSEFRTSERKVWRSTTDHTVFGYVNQYSNLTRVAVSAAGHMVPGDAPEAALDLLTAFVEGKEFNTK